MAVVSNSVKQIWNEWLLRGLILISLASQIILLLLGNIRKYNPRTRVRSAIWFVNSLAFATASAGLGVITQTTSEVSNASLSVSKLDNLNTSELMFFWAPFLLLHLGGPDAITAIHLQDNELYLRHFVEIVFQSGVAVYVLLLSWPGCSPLPQLSVLVYIAGFIKCFERVQALRLANTNNLRDSMLGPADPAPNYHKFLDDLHLKKSKGLNLKVKVDEVAKPLLPAKDHAYPQRLGSAISEAYDLFQTFKLLFVDLILTYEDRHNSQSYFRLLEFGDAFRAVEIELGFAFDMLYTKANVVYTSRGLPLRLTCFSFLLLLPGGFYFLCDMNDYQFFDVFITYLLIGSAILMEIAAIITLLRSDWTDNWLCQQNLTREILIFPFLKQPTKQRWSNSIAQLDLLSIALDEKPPKFLQIQKFFGIDKECVKHRYTTYSKVSDSLKHLIYSQIREFMVFNSDPNALSSPKVSFSLAKNGCEFLKWTITTVEFDQSILLWHIATGLCYYSELENQDDGDVYVFRTESKHISDYLLHLLVSDPVMLPVGIGKIRYRDTCAEAMRFFKEKAPNTPKVEACKMLLQVDCLEVLPSKVMGGQSRSALFDGYRLALSLKNMDRERMWEVMSQVWIEILVYAATNCGRFHHGQQLAKGGEFLTHVWLLMAQLGPVK